MSASGPDSATERTHLAPVSRAPGRRRPSRARWSREAWLSGLLLFGIVLAGNWLARASLRGTIDLSQDQLSGFHPATRALLARLEDLLSVQVYFTGELRHGSVQIAKGRMLDQLRELERLAGGKLELELFDPSASSEARLAAEAAGIHPVPLKGQQGTAEVTQQVYLGLLLRYQGRSQSLPFVLPQMLEYGFAQALSDVMREHKPVIGFLVDGAGDEGTGEAFVPARTLLAARAELREVRGLAQGRAVPEDMQLLVVAAPQQLGARAAYEIDQYVQRGGRLLLLLDRLRVDAQQGSVQALDTGLEDLLRAWGSPLSRSLVWDLSSNDMQLARAAGSAGGASAQLQYPYWIRVTETGMSASAPATGRLRGADLFWAQAFGPESGSGATEVERAPTAVERIDLLLSSPRSWLVEPLQSLVVDPAALNAQGAELLARADGRARPLAVALSGPLPSAFRERGAPAPELPGGGPAPDGKPTGESVRSAERATLVVAVGDADWIRAGYFSEENQLLLANLVDWLTLDGELVGLRARLPRERKITDFLGEERERRGLAGLRGARSLEQAGLDARAEEAAAAAAARRRWLCMLAAGLGSVLLLGVAPLARFLLVRRTLRGELR